ncbi:MAG TPA: DNA alkylation repair protein [Pyrinomonadaceae bacterium]|nr:DNA alkylation repair protein [Pyrinomonadaceae bacterium]
MDVSAVLKHLKTIGNQKNVEGMAYFGITTKKSFGVPTPILKQFAREVKKSADDRHLLALELWETRIYDARAIAFLIDDPKQVTKKQMESWLKDFDNWGTVDGTCCYLFCRTPFAYEKAHEWSSRKREFEKRAAFALMAYLAVHDKKAADEKFADFLPVIERHAYDERNFVKKAVNWALRQIGKRNLYLHRLALDAASRIKTQDSRSARWIASDAIRELLSDKITARLNKENRR